MKIDGDTSTWVLEDSVQIVFYDVCFNILLLCKHFINISFAMINSINREVLHEINKDRRSLHEDLIFSSQVHGMGPCVMIEVLKLTLSSIWTRLKLNHGLFANILPGFF